jgi:hypothetical protein
MLGSFRQKEPRATGAISWFARDTGASIPGFDGIVDIVAVGLGRTVRHSGGDIVVLDIHFKLVGR